MISLASKPKFFLLNALRAFSMLSLLFVFIANIVIMAEDVKALQHNVHDSKDEECDYLEGSGVPNQPLGNFRAFFSIALNLVEIIILFVSETGFPKSFFEKWIPCLDDQSSLVGIGILELLLSAQLLSHFLEPYPLVACFFLLFAGLFNILTMYVDRPRFFRSIEFWKKHGDAKEVKSMESGRSGRSHHAYTHSAYTHSAAHSIYTEKEQTPAAEDYGFARHNDSILSRNPSSAQSGRASSPPTYSPPKQPMRVATKGGGRGVF